MTEGAGLLIGTVQLLVRDAVATIVSRLIAYAGELVATAGLATPLVAEQVGTADTRVGRARRPDARG
jgi:hypothetical protein